MARWSRLRPFALALVLGSVASFASACGAMGDLADGMGSNGSEPASGPPPPDATMTSQEMDLALDCLQKVNEERSRNGVGPVQWLDPASRAAYLFSFDMDRRQFFSHTDPDGRGPGARLTDQGIQWQAYGENIGMGYADADEVMEGWMNSPGHRANILDPEFTHVGIGVRYAAGGPWWTQDFVRLP